MFHSQSIFKKACRANGIDRWPSKLTRAGNIQVREQAETKERELAMANIEAAKLAMAAIFAAVVQPPSPDQPAQHGEPKLLDPLRIEVDGSLSWGSDELTHELPILTVLPDSPRANILL